MKLEERINQQKANKTYSASYVVPISKNAGLSVYTTTRDRKSGKIYYPRLKKESLWKIYEKISTQKSAIDRRTDWAIGRGISFEPIVDNPSLQQQEYANNLRRMLHTNRLYRFGLSKYATGDAFLLVNQSMATGEILGIKYLAPHLTFKATDRIGYYYYGPRTKNLIYLNDFFNQDDITAFSVIHFKLKDHFSSYYGLPDVFAAIESINLENATIRKIRARYDNSINGKIIVFKPGKKTISQDKKQQKQLQEDLTGVENDGGTIIIETADPENDIRVIDLFSEVDEEKATKLLEIFEKKIRLVNKVPKEIIDGTANDEIRFNFFRSIKVDQILMEEFFNNVFERAGLTDFRANIVEEDITMRRSDAAVTAQQSFAIKNFLDAGVDLETAIALTVQDQDKKEELLNIFRQK